MYHQYLLTGGTSPVDVSRLGPCQQDIVKKMQQEECESFSKSGSNIQCIKNLQLRISLKDNTPVAHTNTSVPRSLYQEMKDYLHDLIALGWVEKCTSSYTSPVVCV